MSTLHRSLLSVASRFIAPLLIAAALAGTSAYAADSHVAAARPTHSARTLRAAPTHRQPAETGLDGVLVAPGCPSCTQDSRPSSLLDWVRAQLERLVA